MIELNFSSVKIAFAPSLSIVIPAFVASFNGGVFKEQSGVLALRICRILFPGTLKLTYQLAKSKMCKIYSLNCMAFPFKF